MRNARGLPSPGDSSQPMPESVALRPMGHSEGDNDFALAIAVRIWSAGEIRPVALAPVTPAPDLRFKIAFAGINAVKQGAGGLVFIHQPDNGVQVGKESFLLGLGGRSFERQLESGPVRRQQAPHIDDFRSLESVKLQNFGQAFNFASQKVPGIGVDHALAELTLRFGRMPG